jgi:DNA-binding transcriptional LysR family regulator
MPWIFRKGRENLEVRVEGSLTVNDVDRLLSATLDGISFTAESMVESYIAEGRLIELLVDWSSATMGSLGCREGADNGGDPSGPGIAMIAPAADLKNLRGDMTS